MLNKLKIGSRLFLLTAVTATITIIIALLGLFGMAGISNNMKSVYEDNVEPLVLLNEINAHAISISAEFFRALQHDPASEISQIHNDHNVSEHLNGIEESLKRIDADWKTYNATTMTEEEKKLVAEFNGFYAAFVKDLVQPTLASLRANDYSLEMQRRFLLEYRRTGRPLEQVIHSLTEVLGKNAAEQYRESLKSYESMNIKVWSVFIIGLILSIFLAWQIIRSIILPLKKLETTIHTVKDKHDLSQRVEVSGSDEIGQTAASFNSLMGNLQNPLSEILAIANKLDQAVNALSITAQEVAQGSMISSESSAAMAASVEEMSVSIAHVSQNAQETAEITLHTSEVSQQGGEVIKKTINEMRAMADAVRNSSKIITELGQQSEQISGIVQVIKEVADQTNLLALNAAIEAARAGEQGRGFAVVADEVRKLAERTTKATIEISGMISAIQESSHSAVSAMSQAAERVESGVTLVDQAGIAITDIQEGSIRVQAQVDDITSALTEQDAASRMIAQQVERVAQAAEENSAAVRSASNSVAQVEQHAHDIRDAVAKFTL